MIPTIFQLGPIPIHSFGLMMVLCFLAGMRRLELSLAEHGEDKTHAESMVFWAAIGGLLGARVLFILGSLEQLVADPLGVIFSGAGFVFYGGLIGGFLAVTVYIKKNGLSFWKMADLIGPALAIGYAVGRIGCHLSGDGDYGRASDLPWAVNYAFGAVPTTEVVHPAPIYESISAFLICFLLLKVERAGLLSATGQRAGLYLILMSIERFFIEFIRIESVVFEGLTQAQVFAVGLGVLGTLLAAGVFRHRGLREHRG